MPGEQNVVWWLEQADRYFTSEEIGEAYAGRVNESNGGPAIRQAVLAEASESITERIAAGDNKIAAFNYETTDWPHRARAWLARYEDVVQDRGDDEYTVGEYADAAEIPDEIEMQTTINSYHGENPFDELEPEMARALLYARAADPTVDDEEVVNAIEDPRNFINAVRDVESVTAAIHRQHFDSNVPDSVLREAAPPDEWEIPTESIEYESCTICNETLYEIQTHSGVEWADGSGNIHYDAVDISENDRLLRLDGPSGGLMCADCANIDWRTQPIIGAVLRGNVIAGQFHQSVFRATENSEDPEMMTEAEISRLYDLTISGNLPSTTFFMAQTNGTLPNDVPVTLAERGNMPEVGPVYFHNGNIFLPRDDPDTAEVVKQRVMSEYAGRTEVIP